MRRMEIQSGIAASGSTSKSTGEELAVSRFSKGPPSSDSQSGGERQAVQSGRLGGFQVLTGEELLDVVAVEQGERRGEGQAAPAQVESSRIEAPPGQIMIHHDILIMIMIMIS